MTSNLGTLKTIGKTTVGLALTGSLLVPLAAPARAKMSTPDDHYVRTANYYLKAGTDIRPEHYPQLAEYDLLVFPVEAQHYNPTMFSALRRLNPDIVILAYIPSKSWNYAWVDPVHQKLGAGLQDDWWLRNPGGQQISVWPGTAVLNGVSGWGQYLPRFVRDEVWSTGYWDGIFYDEFSASISWLNGGWVDLHRDGQADDRHLMDVAWKRSMVNLLRTTREYLGPDAVIVTNGDSDPDLQPYSNGRMFETFPTPWEGDGSWAASMGNYFNIERQVGYPAANIINGNTGNTGQNADWSKIRYGLCSALLGNGFFSFDFGESDHGQMWRYDEMEVNLGRPLGPAVNLTLPGSTSETGWPATGLWRRDFENGVSLVNSSGQIQTAALEGEMERLRGEQDRLTNNGAIVSQVSLSPNDGLILLKPLDRLIGSSFPNGAYARVFDSQGQKVRNGFFSYVRPFSGGVRILVDDLDNNGAEDQVVANRGRVQVILNGGNSQPNGSKIEFAPFGNDYTAELALTSADFNGDGRQELVLGGGPGQPPFLQIFNLDGSPFADRWYAYAPNFRGGVNLAAGDLYGYGQPSLVVGAGPTGGPHVRVFNRWGQLQAQFMAYDWAFRGGVNVAVGDFDGDKIKEIATGAGPGGGPHVRIFTRHGRAWNPGFFAADPESRSGIVVATHDSNNDGVDEIIALSTDVFRLTSAAGSQ